MVFHAGLFGLVFLKFHGLFDLLFDVGVFSRAERCAGGIEPVEVFLNFLKRHSVVDRDDDCLLTLFGVVGIKESFFGRFVFHRRGLFDVMTGEKTILNYRENFAAVKMIHRHSSERDRLLVEPFLVGWQ